MPNPAPHVKPIMAAKSDDDTLAGLNGDEVAKRQKSYGVNGIADVSLHPLRRALQEFWTPVPWML